MKQLLEVREFDKISCNPEFKTEYTYLPESIFNDLEEFKNQSDAIIANRYSDKLDSVKDKVYTRDLFQRD